MIEPGAGLAFLGICIMAAVALAKFAPSRARYSNGDTPVTEKVCRIQHTSLNAVVKEQMKGIWDELKHLRDDIKGLERKE